MRSRVPTIISVDWDYFLPFCTDRRYDWGHSEGEPVMYEIMWHARAMPWPEGMKINGNPIPQNNIVEAVQVHRQKVVEFWNRVLAAGSPRKVCIQDSHGKLPEFIKPWGKVNLVNFDAHHDCGYGQLRKQDCANWAHFLKQSGKLNHYTLVYPAWRKEEPEGRIPKHVDRVIYGDWRGKKIKAAGVFVCRSSCWMPSWCDEDWLLLRQLLLCRGPMSGYECEYVSKAREWGNPTHFVDVK